MIEAENPAAVRRLNMFGQAESYVGNEIEAVFPDWLIKRVREEYIACVQTRMPQRYEIIAPDGQATHESTATPVLDRPGGDVTHIVVIMRDVSERKKQETDLARAMDEARSASKAKSEFLASMSHELRTPLNAILGFSELLTHQIGGSLTDKQKEYLGFIHQSGSHLLKIICDILDLSKIDAGGLVLREERTQIGVIVEECLHMVRDSAAAKKLSLVSDLSTTLPDVLADPLRLKQVLLNLLTNAIKFTDNGSVTLEARFDSRCGVVFSVSDTGVGMTEEEARLALEPFGQVESAFSRNHDGTGLGLPIAMRLIALHGGELTLSSAKGAGTRVSIFLPPERACAPEAIDERAAHQAAPGGRE